MLRRRAIVVALALVFATGIIITILVNQFRTKLAHFESFRGATSVSGVVFLDVNGNGLRDPGEEGVPGVGVTAQHKTITTGKDGRYEFTSDEPFLVLSLSWPSGYWPSGNWFHRPEKPVENGVDFGLRPEIQDRPLVFIHFTDPHSLVREATNAIADECRRHDVPARFLIATGDFIGDVARCENMPEARRLYREITLAFEESGLPLFMVPGNHDMLTSIGSNIYGGYVLPSAAEHPLFGKRAWEKYVGPSHWSFACAGVRFVGLEWGEVVDNRMAYLSPAMESWARAEIDAAPSGSKSVLAVHRLAVKEGKFLMAFGQDLTLLGHSHLTGPAFGKDNLLYGGVAKPDGSTGRDGAPPGYRIIEVSPDRINHFFKPFGEHRPIVVHNPRRYFTIRRNDVLKIVGQIFDPRRELDTLTGSFGGRRFEFRRTDRLLWSDFEGGADIKGLEDGFYDLAIAAAYPEGGYSLSEPYLLLTGKEADFTAASPAVIKGAVSGETYRCRLNINGVDVGSVPSRGGNFSLQIPSEALKRLNIITLAGAFSRIRFKNVRMMFEGGEYADHRQICQPNMRETPDLKSVLFIDLTRRGPPAERKLKGPR